MFLHRITIVRNIYAYWILFFLSSTESFSNAFINGKEAICIGGIQQWISIKGSSEKPIFLFLHGGPGNSVMSYAHKFTLQLDPHFLMVHWDQRESGRTADLNQSGEALTLSLFIADAVELIQYLAKRFNKEKIYLAGHSWGGFLALQVAQTAPALLTACIAISPMVHQIESERMSLQWMQWQAQETENTVATAELSKIKVPFETANDLYLHRKWLALLSGGKAPPRAFVESWAQKWLLLFNEASGVDLRSIAGSYACPIYMLVGTKDYQCHVAITRSYSEQLVAPKKEIILLENCGHSIPSTAAAKFQQTILSIAKQIEMD